MTMIDGRRHVVAPAATYSREWTAPVETKETDFGPL